MGYVNFVVGAVKTEYKDAYLKEAKWLADSFIKFGALDYVDGWGDEIPDGKLASMAMAVKAEADETVVISWAVWESKQAHDEGHEKMMAEYAKMKEEGAAMPETGDGVYYDMQRMAFGGFELALKTTKP